MATLATELVPLYEELAEPELIECWSKAVFRRPEKGRLTASPVGLKRGPAVKLVETVGKREETRNVALADWPLELRDLFDEPLLGIDVVGVNGDWHARQTKKGRWLVSRGKPSSPKTRGGLPAHDRRPHYPLDPSDPEVAALFKATGATPDKQRQVEHYVELLRALPIWSGTGPLRVVDAGCGKAYMSLALYLYGRRRGREVELVGIDSNPEVVERVSTIAEELGYEGARFETSTILDYTRTRKERVDLLVSLHACDTATDEAIAAGVRLGAEAIVLAPCCQHECLVQINHALGQRAPGVWAPVVEHGILRARMADLITDSLRSSALEALGYRAEAIEFVAAEHTTKNLMIRAVKRPPNPAHEQRALREYHELADTWGVHPTVEGLVDLDGRDARPQPA
ncbi:MAG: class I SAM-dependent methyltransferase [Gaiellaceae bacterium]